MQERVTVTSQNGMRTADIVIQFSNDLQSVGLGLEPVRENDNRVDLHFVDAIYGGKPGEERIGQLFAERFKQERNINIHDGYLMANAETVLNQELGRWILDSVTGSSESAGVWSWMNRSAVNRLIRLLRKARDASFGRDE